MKIFINKSILFLLLMPLLFGCKGDLETEGISRITYFPDFEMEGDALIIISPGESFTDPGIKAFENGVELSVSSSVTGRFSGYKGGAVGTEPDEYIITYEAVNADGFPGMASRTVIAVNTGDFAPSIEGIYSATTTRSTGESYSGIRVLIWNTGGNTYEISHGIGGFYGGGRNYGDGYLARGGTITINDIGAGDFSFGQMQFPIWGNTVDITDMTIDVATRTISYSTLADFGGVWDVVLTQVQP
ncbi:MAG: DUF5011 domain-containing protein [Cyclobacteriaceae bacterium]|nr:DUF5011 domain-containing protein [Cyclobacteriaceae bacterium]